MPTESTSVPGLIVEITGGHLVAIAAILGGLTFTLLLIAFGLKFVQRRQELWHETARLALEKGQPLPPLPRDMQPVNEAEERSDIRSGLVTIAAGAGLYLFFATFLPFLRFVAAIPGFIGVALLLYGLAKAFSNRKNPPSNRPPQS